MPSSPRSPFASTVNVRNGVESNPPFLITRSAPPCSQTKMRPSGAISIAVGFERPLIDVSVKPGGNVAANAAEVKTKAVSKPQINPRLRPWCKIRKPPINLVLRMAFDLKFYPASGRVALFVRRIVTHDVSLIYVRKNAGIDRISLRRKF